MTHYAAEEAARAQSKASYNSKGCKYWWHGAGERTSVKEIEQVDKLAIEAAPEASSQAIDVPGHNPHAAAGIVCGY